MGSGALRSYWVAAGSLFAALCAVAFFCVAGAEEAGAESDGFEAGEVVVKLAPTSGARIEKINGEYGTTTLEEFSGSARIYLLKLPAGSGAEETARRMEDDARFAYAEPNFVAEAPEGNLRHRAHGTSDTTLAGQYAQGAMGLSCARKIGTGKGATVAVLDTGAQLGHPALRTNFEGVRKYDFVGDDAVPAEARSGALRGHGTHVAGIVDLVAPAARIMPLRVLDADGFGNVFLIAEAVSFAEKNGADVINLSLGTPAKSDLLEDAISDAVEGGVVVVAAAGNDGTPAPHYPAAGEREIRAADGLVAVTAVDKYERKSGFASYGPWVDVAAPGTGIRSAFPVDDYATWSGTSMATPFVAGQAALLQRVDASLEPAGVEASIHDTARPLDAKNPSYAGALGAGHADAGASLERYKPGACS